MQETEARIAIVMEAQSWIGTPYRSNAAVKGRRGGTDCAMFLLAVFQNTGLLPKAYDPRPYPAQWHVHQNVEKYLNQVREFSYEVSAPPDREPKPGDVVLFRIGKLFAHGAIITAWPRVIHAVGNDRVLTEDVSLHTTGKRALWHMEKLFFSLWKEAGA